jgi:DNA-binding GntR family transcriptional regulator
MLPSETAVPLSEQAYQQLRRDILEGQIPPDTKLRVEVLSDTYGFSNTPLREALNRLAAERLVLAEERKGFRTFPVSLDDFWDLTRYRLVIEHAALIDAIRVGDDEWEAGIVAAHHRMEIVQGRTGRDRKVPTSVWTRRHKEFHMALVGGCRSTRMLAACAAMFDQAERYRRISSSYRRKPRDARAEHTRLMELSLARKEGPAAALIRDHIMRTAESVTTLLEDGQSWR